MRRIILFIAMSLDGYIADSNGTYDQVVTKLSPTEWIYSDFITYVITHNEGNSTEKIRFTNENPIDLLTKLKSENGKNIWITIVSVIPTLLGSGIRLFGSMEKEIKLRLLKTQTYNGITDLIYTRR